MRLNLLKNVQVAFDVLADGFMPSSDHQYMRCHMILDVNIENFCCLDHSWGTPTYSNVTSPETVHIALLLAVLKNIDIWAADVLNAYIIAPCHKNISTTLRKESGDDHGCKAKIVRVLYRLTSSGAAFSKHLGVCLHKMGYYSCLADAVLWLREQTDQNGIHYYANVLCYVDDLLVVYHNPRQIMDKIDGFLPLKPDSIAPPKMYLGCKA
ncbi:LOW QUALITY PROTEIN: hypothetical protein ACHAW6_004208 [Cyclotella cf. meneghiniana]